MRWIVILLTLLVSASVVMADVPADWVVNPASFESNGSITADIHKDGVSVADSNDVLAAFDDAVCHGVVESLPSPYGGYVMMLMVYGNPPYHEMFKFLFYDSSDDEVWMIYEVIHFYPDMILGEIGNPEILNLSVVGIEDSNSWGKIKAMYR